MCLVLAGHPFDLIKVRLQTQVLEAGKPPPFTGALDCATKTFRNEGVS
jgi:solute carrier family 25 (mitochondrial oxoglutarate transporter), member 11